ncbi:hypothetical protein [Paenibacillus motobuensis]|uniref:Uncharacterized protein n=1 Tax=Paenibacillus motobuensis TaxID=295324 RepID=A0ABN0YBT6_9BACL
MSTMTQEEKLAQTTEIVKFLTEKNDEAKEAGFEQHAHFVMSVAYTLGSLIGYDLKPTGYGPILGAVIESLTEGLQSAATHKGVKGTFVKIVRD